MAEFNLFNVPEYYTGLLGQEQTDKLKRQALGTGITNALLAFIAQPRTEGFGSALPYLGRALMAGQQAGQEVVAGGLKDWETRQKIEELARQKKAREQFDVAAKGLYKTIPAQMETVTTPGGYAPAQTDIQAGQVAPNFGMTRMPDVTSQREIAPARQELNPEALQQMLLSGDARAGQYLTGLKTLKELTTPAKSDLIKYGAEEGIYDPNKREVVISPTKKEKEKTYTGTWANIALNEFQTDNPAQLTKAQRDWVSNEAAKQTERSAPKSIVNMPFETDYSKTLGKNVAESQLSTYQNVEKSLANINKIDRTLNQIETGDINTGLGASIRTNVDRFKSKVFADNKAGKRVSDTEILDAFLGSDVFPQIGALGIGAKGLDTPAEREFLRSVMTGTIEMDRNTLAKMTKLRRDIEERAIRKYNSDVQQGKYDRFFRATGYPKIIVPIPSASGDGYIVEEVR